MTSTERRRTWSERLDPRNWSLVAKLAVVGLVPTVLALAIGAVRVVDQANVAEELGRGSGLVEAHQQVEALTGALQTERAAAVTFVSGNRLGDRNALDSAQSATDEALDRANRTLETAEQQAPQLATARRQADTTLGQLPVIRSQVGSAPTPALDVTTRYTSVLQRTLALDRALLGQLQTSDTVGLAGALSATATAEEALELERAVIGGAIVSQQLQEPQRALVNGAEASFQAAASDFQAALSPQQVDAFGNFATDPANTERQTLRDAVMAAPGGRAGAAEPAAWNAAVDRSTAVLRGADDQVEQEFIGGRERAAEAAGNTAGLNSVLLMLGLLLTIGIVLLLGRQLVRSLRVLRTSALDVAERRLPQAVQSMRAGQTPSALVEPVPLESRDEIGEVARAFDAVHGQAIRLAADQAALQQNVNSMFVNLSRRSQALVERQLQLIEQLESNEQDPDQLSNLFQLDHLATRMRRNSENLLVLAGTDLAKRNVAPVQVVDVLRAAVSEVEQYQRVVLQTPPTATIAGRAANDLVHLLAELLDNATNFSPPDSQVVMSTTRVADESLLIEISDRGVGMADSELADANQRLSGPSEVDVSASRRMGLFVVGRLAARHRIGVRLSSASGVGRSGGLSASVTVPPQLVPSGAPADPVREAVGAGEPGAGPGRPGPDRAAALTNGGPRNGSRSSTVTGVDGPMAPMSFGSTTTGAGPARNGSMPKLPTRTPGSALRRNPADSGGSTNDQESAVNGSNPRGMNAFLPSGPGHGAPDAPNGEPRPDMFTPASDVPTGGPAPDGAPRTGWSGPTQAGPRGPEGPQPPRTPDAPAADEEPTEVGVDAAEASGRTARPETPEQTPEWSEPFGETGDATVASAATVTDTTDVDDAVDVDDTTVVDEESGTGAESGTDDERPGTADDSGRTALGAAGVVGGAATVGSLAAAFRRRDERDEIDDGAPDEPEPTGADGTTGDTGLVDGTGVTGEPEPVAAGPDEDVVRTGDTADDLPAAFFAGPGPEGPGAVEADDTTAEDGTAAGTGGPAPGDPADELDEADSDTTAFPRLRTPREPMGGQRPGATRPGPPRPAPARRPVMPGPRPDEAPAHPDEAPARAGGAPRPEPAPPARAARGKSPEELFAPAVPVEGDRGQLRRPGGLESAKAGGGYDMSQTTPIFEEIASAWFRSNRSVPVRWQDGAPGGRAGRGPEAGAPRPAGPGRPPGPGAPAPAPGALGGPRRPTPGPRPASTARPAGAPSATGGPNTVDEAEFASPADEVWRQASAGTETESPDELTSAGLPKRRPRARLLPGSAAGSTVLSPPAATEARSAETVRGRLASYQQGVRQGRDTASGRTDRAGDDSAPAPGGRQQAGREPHSDRPNTSDHEENP